ncbi:MAG: hypothetical protein K2W95_08870 [Candidatus Obscuribacterales bacterium]|nr:hypothetical protein [Candidatus Obscuribacterales bacterium]
MRNHITAGKKLAQPLALALGLSLACASTCYAQGTPVQLQQFKQQHSTQGAKPTTTEPATADAKQAAAPTKIEPPLFDFGPGQNDKGDGNSIFTPLI